METKGLSPFIIWKSFTFKLILKSILFSKPKGYEKDKRMVNVSARRSFGGIGGRWESLYCKESRGVVQIPSIPTGYEKVNNGK